MTPNYYGAIYCLNTGANFLFMLYRQPKVHQVIVLYNHNYIIFFSEINFLTKVSWNSNINLYLLDKGKPHTKTLSFTG